MCIRDRSETLSRSLRQLRDDGLIEVRGPSIRVLDCPGLKSRLG
jgi:hypothetical protein